MYVQNNYPFFAEYENRTRVYCLGSSHSATELIPLFRSLKNQNQFFTHRQIREKNPPLFSAPFILTSSPILSTMTIIFSPGLATSNLFLISPSRPDSLSSLAASAANSVSSFPVLLVGTKNFSFLAI